ncbi:MAG: GTPase ObgE [Clostridia bacterium]|nr:GTPase ObgE [Clostridia bacterium]
MFLDIAKIYIKAGNGGNGKLSFYRSKQNLCGGPDGGNGGKGGDIIFVADSNMSTLIDFKYRAHYRAENGGNGDANNSTGKSGADLIIKVPAGTIIKDFETNMVIADMFENGYTKILLKGGRGGKGNSCFATPTRRSPCFAQNGVKTEEKKIKLELKTIADIGLIGFPNVGKSTLLSVLTEARPKIANYHFTTLSPNLGVIKLYETNYVIADIPGLIEGASEGIGLGHEFLRHIERVRMLVHILDISGSEQRDPVEDYFKIKDELTKYNPKLMDLPEIVVGNKLDICTMKACEAIANKINKKIFPISAILHDGVEQLIKAIADMVVTLPPPTPIEEEVFVYQERDDISYEILKNSDGSFEVSGGFIDMLVRNVVLSDVESNRYFQHKLKERGIFDALRKEGAKDGDIIHISDIEFEFIN